MFIWKVSTLISSIVCVIGKNVEYKSCSVLRGMYDGGFKNYMGDGF